MPHPDNENENGNDNQRAPTKTPTRTPTNTRVPTATRTPRPAATDTPEPTPTLAPASISGISPSRAICGQPLTIRGDRFGDDRGDVDGKVYVDGRDASISDWDMAEIRVNVPLLARGGNSRLLEVIVAGQSMTKEIAITCQECGSRRVSLRLAKAGPTAWQEHGIVETMQKERLRPPAQAERRELVAIAKASSVLQLDPPAWKAGEQVR